MKYGTHEVIHVIARNAEMRRVFQGRDLIYEIPDFIPELEDFVSTLGKNHDCVRLVCDSIPSGTEYYPKFPSHFTFETRCRLSKLKQYETKYYTYYKQSSYNFLRAYLNLPDSSSYILYDPGVYTLFHMSTYTDTSTYCRFSLYALHTDSSNYVRSYSGYNYVPNIPDSTGQYVPFVYDTYNVNTERYADCSTGFVIFDAGYVMGENIYVKTNFCPTEDEYHTYKTYIEITEDSSNNIIIPHLEIDGVDYSRSFSYDKSISIHDYIYAPNMTSTDAYANLKPSVGSSPVPMVEVQSFNNGNLVMNFRDNTPLMSRSSYNTTNNLGTRIDYNTFNIKIDYELFPEEDWIKIHGTRVPYPLSENVPKDLGSILIQCVPTTNVSYPGSEVVHPIALYCSQVQYLGYDPTDDYHFPKIQYGDSTGDKYFIINSQTETYYNVDTVHADIELEYIANGPDEDTTKSCYFDTGLVIGTFFPKVEVKAATYNTSSTCTLIGGVKGNSWDGVILDAHRNGSAFASARFNTTVITADVSINSNEVFTSLGYLNNSEVDPNNSNRRKGYLIYNGSHTYNYSYIPVPGNKGVNVCLLAQGRESGVTITAAPSGTKIYYAKIWDNNTLIRNYIPVLHYINNQYVPCFKDQVNGTYIYNSGTDDPVYAFKTIS